MTCFRDGQGEIGTSNLCYFLTCQGATHRVASESHQNLEMEGSTFICYYYEVFPSCTVQLYKTHNVTLQISSALILVNRTVSKPLVTA